MKHLMTVIDYLSATAATAAFILYLSVYLIIELARNPT